MNVPVLQMEAIAAANLEKSKNAEMGAIEKVESDPEIATIAEIETCRFRNSGEYWN